MKKLLTAILAAVLLSSCAAESEPAPPLADQISAPAEMMYLTGAKPLALSDRFEINAIADTVSPEGGDFNFQNRSDEPVTVGYNYSVRVVEDAEEFVIDCPDFETTTGLYTVDPGESATLSFDWSKNYGALPDGKYCIYVFPSQGEDSYTQRADFTVGSGEYNFGNAVLTTLEDESVPFELAGEFDFGGNFLMPAVQLGVDNVTPEGAYVSIYNGLDGDISVDSETRLCKRETSDGETVYYDIRTNGVPYASAPITIVSGGEYGFDEPWGSLLGVALPDGDYTLFKYFYFCGETFLTSADFSVREHEADLGYLDGVLVTEVPEDTDVPEAEKTDKAVCEIVDAKPEIMPITEEYAECEVSVEILSADSEGAKISVVSPKATNSDGKFELNVVCGGEKYRLVSPEHPAATVIYTVSEEPLSLDLSWSERFGSLPDGEYELIFFSDLGAATASFKVGSEPANIDSFALDGFPDNPTEDLPAEPQECPKGAIGAVSTFENIKSSDKNITLEMSDVHSYGAAVSFKNDRDENVMYGSGFRIEKKIGERWYTIQPNPDVFFPATSLWIEPGETVSGFENWENLYLGLPNGEYRLIKSFYINDRAPVVPEEDLVYLGFEFAVDDYGEPRT